MSALIKICGITASETLDAAIHHGASHVGLVHYAPSPRHLALDEARKLCDQARGKVKVVLLLVNPTPQATVDAINAVRPDIIQFHGNESPQWLSVIRQHAPIGVWKAFGLKDRAGLDRAAAFAGAADRILFDAPAQALPGGTGTRFDWELLKGYRHQLDWGLAGGLSPDNVAAAIAATGAPLVDVSSGVESAPGIKDVDKISAFCQAVRTLS